MSSVIGRAFARGAREVFKVGADGATAVEAPGSKRFRKLTPDVGFGRSKSTTERTLKIRPNSQVWP